MQRNGDYSNPAPLEERAEDAGELAHQDPATDEQPAYAPAGWNTAEEFLEYARNEFAADLEADKDNREEGLADLEFIAGEQWPDSVKKQRESQNRPCMTINTLPQFVGQVIGDRRMNRTSVRVVAKENADKELADIRAGIIRNIEQQSKADRVYDAALEDQVSGGIGNFRIVMDYAGDDVFEQDIFVRQIPNAFSVVWDRMSVDPTGRDAKRCFVQDIIPRTAWEREHGKESIPTDLGAMELGTAGLYGAAWVDKDAVRVTEFWELLEKDVQICMLLDGSVKDFKPPMDVSQIMKNAAGKPLIRTVKRKYARMHLITGWKILEGPYELPITRLPIIRVSGREIRIGERRVRFGLVRWARDPARMRNYWRSVAVETLAMAPKNQWLAQHKSVKGREEDFREAHLNNDPLLIYNDNTDAPVRSQGPQMPAAVLQEVAMNNQDIKDTTGLQDASLGIRSNEVSGKAIMARQQEGDVATVIYHDNLNSAIEEGGSVINQLIPICYDTTRTLRVIGADEKDKLIKVNDPMDPNSVDLSKGKYDVAVITGPSYTTQRMMSAEAMLEAVKVAPQIMQVAGDLLVKAQDWPGAEEISERLKRAMPPELIKDPDAPPTPEELAAKQQADQVEQLQLTQAQEQEEHAAAMRDLEVQEKQLLVQELGHKVRAADAMADKAESEAERAELELNADTVRIPGEIMSNGGRPQAPSRDNGNPAANPGSQPGRQSRRPKRTK